MITEETLKQLSKTILPKWRIQSSSERGANMISYIDARDVQNTLDDVVGISNWQDSFYESKGKQFCSISIKIGNEWISKSDCGTPSQTEAEKGEVSDAFKRAAVKWGINRKAYSYGTVFLNDVIKNAKGKYIVADENGRPMKQSRINEICSDRAKISEEDAPPEINVVQYVKDQLAVIAELHELNELFRVLKSEGKTESKEVLALFTKKKQQLNGTA